MEDKKLCVYQGYTIINTLKSNSGDEFVLGYNHLANKQYITCKYNISFSDECYFDDFVLAVKDLYIR